MCNCAILGRRTPRGDCYESWYMHDVRAVVIRSKFGVDRSRDFSRRALENRRLPLKAYRSYTTLPCTAVDACDVLKAHMK
jgi:hypothetical protein